MNTSTRHRVRWALASLRLLLLYALLCWLLVLAGLLWRTVQQQDAWLANSFPQAETAATLPFRGITAELDALSSPEQQRRLADLRAAGYGWLRHRFDWAQLEPQAGQFDWAAADALLTAITAAGLEPVVVLDGSPAWARAPQDRAPTDNPLAPPANPADFARFAAAFAARYGAQVRFYQIWDEPNIAPHWGNRLIEPVAYAQLLKSASTAIRAADDNAQIITAALAPTTDRGHAAIDEPYFLERLLAAGAADAFDIVAVQPFGFGDAPTHGRQAPTTLNFQRAALIRRTLVAAGQASKPLLAARFGWNRRAPSPWGSVTAADQASYARAALDHGWRQWPWLIGMGWAVDRPAAPAAAPAWGFAIVEPEGAATPLGDTLAGWQPPAASVRGSAAPFLTFPVSAPWVEAPTWLALILLVIGAGLVGWRGWAAGRSIPWRTLGRTYRNAPHWVHGGTWATLLLAYYFVTWPPLIALTWLGWTLLALAQPQIGLGIAALLLPFYFQHKEVALVDATLQAPPATVAAFCLAPALLSAARRQRFRPLTVDWVAVALLGLSLFAAINVWQWPAYWRGMVTLVLTPLGLWLAVRMLARDEAALLRLARWLVAGGGVAALWGVIAWLQGGGIMVDDVRRLVGPHFSPNHTALYLVRTGFLTLGLAMAATRPRRAGWFTLCTLIFGAVGLTGSRGAVVGLVAGATVYGALAVRRRPALVRWLRMRRRAVVAIGVGLGVLLLGAIVWQWARLSNWQTVVLRGELWGAALALWQAHPWMGVGPGGFFWSYPAFLPAGAVIEPNQLHPHNIWLELATTWGVLGLAWFAALLWATWCSRTRRVRYPARAYWLATGIAAALVAGIVHGQTDAFFLLADIAGWNAFAWAMLINLDRFAATPATGLQS